MDMDDDPTVDELRQRQLARERAAREELAEAETDEEAQTSARRADKARYLREKLEQQEQADRDAADQAG